MLKLYIEIILNFLFSMRRREKFIVLPASTEMVQRRWSEFKGCPEKTVLQILLLLLDHIQMKLKIEER